MCAFNARIPGIGKNNYHRREFQRPNFTIFPLQKKKKKNWIDSE